MVLVGAWKSDQCDLKLCSWLNIFEQTGQTTPGRGGSRREEEEGVETEGLKSSDGDGKGSGLVGGGCPRGIAEEMEKEGVGRGKRAEEEEDDGVEGPEATLGCC